MIVSLSGTLLHAVRNDCYLHMIQYVLKIIVRVYAVQNDSIRVVVNPVLCSAREYTSLIRVLWFHRVAQTHNRQYVPG